MRLSDDIESIDIGLVCNPGGHLQSMKLLSNVYEGSDYAFITHESVTSKNLSRTVFFTKKEFNSRISISWIIQLIYIFSETFKLMVEFRPKMMISTGGYLSVPVFIISYLFGCRLIFIENVSRRNSRSLSGRLMYPMSDRFFVQHEETLELYGDKAEYYGSIL